MNVALVQTIILGLLIFLDHRSLSSIDQNILMTPPPPSPPIFCLVINLSPCHSSSFSFCLLSILLNNHWCLSILLFSVSVSFLLLFCLSFLSCCHSVILSFCISVFYLVILVDISTFLFIFLSLLGGTGLWS